MDDDQIPHARKGKMCPKHMKDMSEVCHDCGWWVGLHWTDPATKEVKSKWNCAVVMNVLTNVDVTKSMTGVQAATESMRNEMVKRAASPPAWAVKQIVQEVLEKEQREAFEAAQLALGLPEQKLLQAS